MMLSRQHLIDYLHLFVLASLAIAQPLYDLLGRYADFFVSHGAGPSVIIFLVLAVSVIIPVLLILAEVLAGLIFGNSVRRYIHLGLTGIFAGLIVLPVLNRWNELPVTLVYIVTVVTGGLFILIYTKWKFIRSFLTALSPAVLIFPAYFLFFTPIKSLFFPKKPVPFSEIRIRNKVPVILIVFDEFNTMSLLDKESGIDSVRFPNFATLAGESWWFPEAVCASLQTLQSVPAILTGQIPSMTNKKLAVSAHHPFNLFTLLAGQYYFNVHESETSICPDTLKKYARIFEPFSFISDIRMIYRVLFIPGLMKTSPDYLDGRWKGFDNDSPRLGRDGPPGIQQRRKQIRAFTDGIYAGKKNQLDFIHLTLPHVPYEFLSSGRSYNITSIFPEGIISDEAGWGNSVDLVETAYQRYLQQVGFTDRVLGNIIASLKEKKIYDESLIIVTADHGVSMQPGKSRRSYSKGNQHELFKVPMFLKLPGQKNAGISHDLVSGIDILPTIAGVLGIKLSWDPDGQPMIPGMKGKKETVGREKIGMPGLGEFNLRDIEGFPQLKSKISVFGSGTPLEDLARRDPNHSLLGMDIREMEIRPGAHPFTVQLENPDQFRYIELRGEYLPVMLRGHITNVTEERKLALAIALNGIIRSTTSTSGWMAENAFFNALLPETAFKQGENTLDIFTIQADGAGLDPYLVRIPSANPENIHLRSDKNGREWLIIDNGEKIPVTDQKGGGFLDNFHTGEYNVLITGWAFDKKEGLPVTSVVIFSGDLFLVRARPCLKRNDLVPLLKTEKARFSGYRVEIPSYIFTGEMIRAFGITKQGTAYELNMTGMAKDSIKNFIKRKF